MYAFHVEYQLHSFSNFWPKTQEIAQLLDTVLLGHSGRATGARAMSFALAVGLALLGVSLMLVTVIVLLVRARLHEIRREGNVTMASGPARHDMTVPLAAASGRDKAPPPAG